MSASDALQRRQFTPDEVEAHVPGAFALGDVKSEDRFEKRLVPLESVHFMGKPLLDIHPGEVSQLDPPRVHKMIPQMKKDASVFPPVVVTQDHGFLDGYGRMHAATAAGIRHGAAYVRVNR